MAHVRVVHGAGQTVEEDEANNDARTPGTISDRPSLLDHFLPVAHVNHSLREEDSIVVDHQEGVVQVHVFGLDLVQIEADMANWTDEFDPDGIVVTVSSWDEELEGIHEEHDCSQDSDGWE
jgi:hypothetical protein